MRRPGGGDTFDERIGRFAALGEPVRRALYRYVATQAEPVSRDQAATAVGVARHVAKFHLDRLEADGLLETSYSRPPERRGPGAGRPAKRYRRAAKEFSVSLPERSYDLAGRVFARAIVTASTSGTTIHHAMQQAARGQGHELGETVKSRLDGGADSSTCEHVVRDVLAEHGYEPRDEGNVIRLANCPFHALAEDYRELVCGMNLDLISGLLETCEHDDLQARLDPAPGRCCVALDRQPGARTAPARHGR